MNFIAKIAITCGLFSFYCNVHAMNSTINSDYKELSYGRIHLLVHPSQLPKINEYKYLIDSVFSFTDQCLQNTELRMGYKINSDIYLVLSWELSEYQKLFSTTKISQEQRGIQSEQSMEKILPLFVVQSFHDIKSDIQFLVTYYLLDEFLHGVGVKQRLNQSDAIRLPMWLIHGYCYELAESWNAKDADEFHYFQTRNFYKNIHKIPVESQAVFGKYIWHNLLKYPNKNLASTIWFTVKYTNQLNEAFQFHFQKNFDEWFSELPKLAANDKAIRSDMPFISMFRFKVINDFVINKNNDMVFWLSDDLNDWVVLVTEGNKKIQLLQKSAIESTNTWRSKRQFQLELQSFSDNFMVYEREGNVITQWEFSTEGKTIKKDSHYIPIPLINQGANLSACIAMGAHLKDFMELLENEVVSIHIARKLNNTDFTYALVAMKSWSNSAENKTANATNSNYLGYYSIHKTEVKPLRMDTSYSPFVVGSLLNEESERVSFSLGGENSWKLNFIEFNQTSDFSWNTGYTFRNFKHFRDYRDRIIEFGYLNGSPIAVLIENWKESKQDIVHLYKQNFPIKDTLVLSVADSSNSVSAKMESFKFIGAFAEHSWINKLRLQVVRRYTGEFGTKPFISSYYLKHAGVFLTNYENRDLPYVNQIPLSNLINSPFTPLIRLHVSDIANSHNIQIQMFSNIVGSRLGMEMQQTVKTKSQSEITNTIVWRNRNFTTLEKNSTKNSAIFTSLAYKDNWSNHFSGIVIGSFRYEALFPRISNLSIPIPAFHKSYIAEFRITTEYKTKPENKTSYSRWNVLLASSAGTAYYFNSGSGNWDLRLNGSANKKIGRLFNYKSRISARYSLGKTQTLYMMGGTDGWINDIQFINQLPSIKTPTNFALLGFGLPVRGLPFGSRLGSSYFGFQQQLEIEVFKSLINRQIKNIFISDFSMYPLADIGIAFIGKSPADLSNPYNTRLINTGNYRLWYSALHNPWILSYGIGFKTYLMGFPIKYEVTRPYMDKKFLGFQHLFGLQWDF